MNKILVYCERYGDDGIALSWYPNTPHESISLLFEQAYHINRDTHSFILYSLDEDYMNERNQFDNNNNIKIENEKIRKRKNNNKNNNLIDNNNNNSNNFNIEEEINDFTTLEYGQRLLIEIEPINSRLAFLNDIENDIYNNENKINNEKNENNPPLATAIPIINQMDKKKFGENLTNQSKKIDDDDDNNNNNNNNKLNSNDLKSYSFNDEKLPYEKHLARIFDDADDIEQDEERKLLKYHEKKETLEEKKYREWREHHLHDPDDEEDLYGNEIEDKIESFIFDKGTIAERFGFSKGKLSSNNNNNNNNDDDDYNNKYSNDKDVEKAEEGVPLLTSEHTSSSNKPLKSAIARHHPTTNRNNQNIIREAYAEVTNYRPPQIDENDSSNYGGFLYQGQLLKFERINAHLANERTWLAWVRLSLTLLSVVWSFLEISEQDNVSYSTFIWFLGGIYALVTLLTWITGWIRYKRTKALLQEGNERIQPKFGHFGVKYTAFQIALILIISTIALFFIGVDLIWNDNVDDD